VLSGISFFKESSFTTVSVVLSYTLILILPLLAYQFFLVLKSIQLNAIKFTWFVLALFYVFLLFFVFPGFVGYDDVATTSIVQNGMASGWQSLTYSFIVAMGHIILGGFGLTIIISIFLFLFLSLKTMKLIDGSIISPRKKIALIFILFLLAIHPINQAMLLFHCRDSLFSLFLILLSFQLLENRTWKISKIIYFTTFLIILGDLRQEAKIYLLVFPFFLLYLKRWNFREIKFFLIFCLVLSFFYYKLVSDYFQSGSYGYAYQVTSYVMPLSQIFHDLPDDKISESDLKSIDKVLNVEMLRKYFSPVDIDPFHNGAFTNNLSKQQWARFKTAAHALILQNPTIFLNNRIYLLKSMLNIGHPPLIISDDLRMNKQSSFTELVNKIHLQNNVSELSKYSISYRNFLFDLNKSDSLVKVLLNSMLMPCLFLIFCILTISIFPALGSIAVVVGVRLPILFLFAPANYMKYIYSLFLLFTFFFIIYLSKFFEKRLIK
jgi:hypothetical protein